MATINTPIGNFMNPAYEAIAQLLTGAIEVGENQPPGVWLRLPDSVTRISGNKQDQYHPCLAFSLQNRRHGFIEIWIRSTSISGEIPRVITHEPHQHHSSSNCPLTQLAYIDVKSLKRIPKVILERYPPRCVEKDLIWLRTFQRCCIKIHNKTYHSVF